VFSLTYCRGPPRKLHKPARTLRMGESLPHLYMDAAIDKTDGNRRVGRTMAGMFLLLW
jgi:hypothetical protein